MTAPVDPAEALKDAVRAAGQSAPVAFADLWRRLAAARARRPAALKRLWRRLAAPKALSAERLSALLDEATRDRPLAGPEPRADRAALARPADQAEERRNIA